MFFYFLYICRFNLFIMYQQCYLRWNSGFVEENVVFMMDQKLFIFKLVKFFCGIYRLRKFYGCFFLLFNFIFFCVLDYEFVNVVKCGKLKRGRCFQCLMGVYKKRVRVEIVYGCLYCNVRLCRDKCYEFYYSRSIFSGSGRNQ